MQSSSKTFDALPPGAVAVLDGLIDRLEDGWRKGCPPAIGELLDGCDPPLDASVRLVAESELTLTDLEFRMRQGCSSPGPSDLELPWQFGKFRLLARLGSGSFGDVYHARDAELGRDVAVKMPRLAKSGDRGERFLREARHLARLRHPAIVSIFEAGRTDDTCYLACALLRGGTLRDRLSEGPMPHRRAAEIVVQVAEALAYAHREGVVHRDVKPSNILFDDEGRPYLSDFGLAKSDAVEATLTADGALLGTPAYMSPEQLAGENGRVDARSDIYSLGVVLYELLTGELPYQGHPRMMLVQILNDEPRHPRRFDDRIPLDLESVCLKAMAKEPAWRYPSARALADDLRHFLDGRTVTARPLGRLGRGVRWCRRRPLPAALAVGLLAACACGVAGVTWQWRRAETHAARAALHQARAERNFQRAFQTLADISRLTSTGNFDGAVDMRPMQRELADLALAHYESFLKDESGHRLLAAQTIEAHLLKARICEATLGDRERAIESYRDALRLLERPGAEAPADPHPVKWQTVGVYHAMASPLIFSGKYDEAASALASARVLCDELVRDCPERFEYRCLQIEGLLEQAALEYLRSRPAPAAKTTREADALLGQLTGEAGWDAHQRLRVGACYAELGGHYQKAPDLAAAGRACRRAETLLRLAEENEQTADHVRRARVDNADFLGLLERDCGHLAEALAAHQLGCELIEPLVARQPFNMSHLNLYATHLYHLARVCGESGDAAEAIRNYRRSATGWERLAAEQPTKPEYRRNLAASYHNLGNLHRGLNRFDEAVGYYRESVPLWAKLCEERPGDMNFRSCLSGTLFNLAEALEELGRPDEALSAVRQAAELERQVVAAWPDDKKWRKRLDDRLRAIERLSNDSH